MNKKEPVMCVVTRAGLVSVTIGEQSGNKKRLNIITKKKIIF